MNDPFQQITIEVGAFLLCFLALLLLFRVRRSSQQTAIRKALIEKVGSAQDLGEFLQSESGHRFLTGLSSGSAAPLTSVLMSVQAGVILLLLGLGCIGASAFLSEQVGLAIGVVLLFLGIGFLASAGITYRLSKRWGLLDSRGPRDRMNP